MTQEEKEMLIKDLSGRLPYGVIVQVNDRVRGSYDRRLVQVFCDRVSCSVNVCNPLKECICLDSVKPYLRPLSSMTEEECDELKQIMKCDAVTDDSLQYAVGGCVDYDDFLVYYEDSYKLNDWLNKNMFDFRWLIPKGLAIETPDGMYEKTSKE